MSSGSGSSSRVAGNLNLPAGFRFHPTDEELIVHYLMNQAASIPCPVPIIAEVNIYQCNPWDLPAKALFGENEWYFFSPRDRKYPNGVRPNRAAGSGYWKATGTDKAILSTPTSQNIGVKKALVFYSGRPPKGVKTDWIMHEYRLTGTDDRSSTKRRAGSSSMRLDDWVLCRIHKKSNDFHLLSDQEQEQEHEHEQEGSTVEELDTLLNNNMNDSTETALADQYHEQQQIHHQTMSKSCSLTDHLNSIDYAALSQMFLLDIPADAEAEAEAEPSQQIIPPLIYPPAAAAAQTTHQALVNNYENSVTMNSSSQQVSLPTDAAVDAVVICSSDNSSVNKRKRVMAVDGGATAAAESLDDGSNSFSNKKLKLPSDSRIGGHFGTTSIYCNNQLQLVDSTMSGGFHHQYSSSLLLSTNNPFFNQHQQLLLNSHIGMQ